MSSGCGKGLNWMVRLGGKAKRRMGWVKEASEDLACRRGLARLRAAMRSGSAGLGACEGTTDDATG